MKKPIPIDVALASKTFAYDPESGILRRRKNEAIVGALNSQGQLVVGFEGRQFFVHRLCWAIHYQYDPANMAVDHINGDRSDNRISNLRLATHAQNMRNRKIHKNNSLGIKGVWLDRGRYRASITINGKVTNLGRYDTPEQAEAVYKAAAEENFGEFANHISRAA